MTLAPLEEIAALEKYGHVQERICVLWGTPELDRYLNQLLTDSRDGKRSGFPLEATAEILFLAELNKMVRAIDLARRLKLPLSDAYAKVDLQDRGPQVGDPAEPLAGRDAYAREEREFAARPLPQRSTERESLAARAGRGVFGLFFSKLLFFALALFLAWQYVVPLFFK